MNETSSGPFGGSGINERLGRTKQKSWWRRYLWWEIAAAVIVALILFVMFGPKPHPTYTFQPVSKGGLTLIVSATGTLAPRVSVDVGAEVSGRIDELYVDYNDHVTKGQKLAQINTDQIVAQLDQARATLQQQEATLVQSEARMKRLSALVRSNSMSQQDYDAAKGDFLRAKGGVALGTAQVQQIETSLQKATIYAPIEGVVLDRKVSKGQTVVASFNTPVLFTLASDLTQMELDVDIDEADVGIVHTGQNAHFTVGAYPDKQFDAHLTMVRTNSQTVQNVVTYKGILVVDNGKLLLRPGMTATAEIITGHLPSATLVPNAALRFVPPTTETTGIAPAPVGTGLGRVWTVVGKKLKPHDLKLGGSDGHSTQMVQGDLTPGDQVIIDAKMPGTP
ncbi:MAG: efflux RND transporter periplasmic adaptor subunit [Rhizomicrobium sp.]|nr:efflux RND transporter periplasmic adaptor subunit [Rhizomicrobium sp.]